MWPFIYRHFLNESSILMWPPVCCTKRLLYNKFHKESQKDLKQVNRLLSIEHCVSTQKIIYTMCQYRNKSHRWNIYIAAHCTNKIHCARNEVTFSITANYQSPYGIIIQYASEKILAQETGCVSTARHLCIRELWPPYTKWP